MNKYRLKILLGLISFFIVNSCGGDGTKANLNTNSLKDIAVNTKNNETSPPSICKNYNYKNLTDLPDSNLKSRKIWEVFNEYFKNRPERKLIVFFDGTANSASDLTNIRVLYKLAVQRACDGDAIIPFYDKGVGTSKVGMITALITGQGVSLNIRQGYRFLVEAYKPGDKVYIFGFSRGAFEARSLNGFIEYAGLIDKTSKNGLIPEKMPKIFWFASEYEKFVKDIYKHYKVHGNHNDVFESQLRKDITNYEKTNYPDIKFLNIQVEGIGVFDTVPALGPKRAYNPDNHRLDLYAKKGFHALSLDEQRKDFKLNRFKKLGSNSNQMLKEVWFPGGHANVGGGYDKSIGCQIANTKDKDYYDGLEASALNWMISNFKEDHIFPDNLEPIQECAGGKLHDEYFDGLSIYKKLDKYVRRPDENDIFHKSILERTRIPKLVKPHRKREPESVYKPTNISYPLDKHYIIE